VSKQKPCDIRDRLRRRDDWAADDAADIIDDLVRACQEVIDHYRGMEEMRPVGTRPCLTDCVESATKAIARVEGRAAR
jgi:hypothetical protein